MSEQCCRRLHTHRLSHQVSREASGRSLMWDKGQWDALASSTWPLPPDLLHTHLLSLCSREPDYSLWGMPSESSHLLPSPRPHPAILDGGRHRHSEVQRGRGTITCPGAPMGPGSPLGPTGPGRPGDPCDRAV